MTATHPKKGLVTVSAIGCSEKHWVMDREKKAKGERCGGSKSDEKKYVTGLNESQLVPTLLCT